MSEENNTRDNEPQLTFLMSSLKEGQDSVRAFDTKAQIVGIGYIFTINIVAKIGSFNPDTPDYSALLVIASWIIVMIPIIMFGAVLYPSRKNLHKTNEQPEFIKGLYNTPSKYNRDIDLYLSDLNDCNVQAELSYELIRILTLRDLKRIRFLRALYTSVLSFILLFSAQLLRTADTLIM